VLLPDVNVIVSAYREDAEHHPTCLRVIEGLANGASNFALSELVLSGFVRVVTHPRVFELPSPVEHALAFAESLRELPNAGSLHPGDRHWSIFGRLCRQAGAKGNLVPDAYLAALAIEHGCEWITLDRDFSRFDGLKWRTPAQVLAQVPAGHERGE
jgi:hypothetical protein